MSLYNLSDDLYIEHKVLEIYGNRPLTQKLFEIMQDYEAIEFKSHNFNQSLDRLPSHIKYVDLSSTLYFTYELNNLPPGLLGIAFNTWCNCYKYCENLPYGIKYICFNGTRSIDINNILTIVPNSIRYICTSTQIYTIENYKIVKRKYIKYKDIEYATINIRHFLNELFIKN